MIFCIYFSLSWLLVISLLFIKSSFPIQMTAFLYLFICTFHSNLYFIIASNLKGFTIESSPLYNLSYILWIIIIVPCIYIFGFKLLYLRRISFTCLILFAIFISLSLALLEIGGAKFQMITNHWWNIIWSFAYFAMLFFLSYIASSWFQRLEVK